jgi:putative flippase GtrA
MDSLGSVQPLVTRAGSSGQSTNQNSVRNQGARFTVIGSAGTALRLAVFAAISELTGAQVASVISWLLSTLVTNAAHRSLTFGVHGAQHNRSDQLVAFTTSLVGLAISAIVLARLNDADGTAGLIAILAVNTLVGAARFAGLRWWLRRSNSGTPTMLRDPANA